MEDNRDIAFLAASCDREMKGKFVGGSNSTRQDGSWYNRTDWRNFLGPGQPQPQPAQQQYPQHGNNFYPNQGFPPQFQQPPPYNPGNAPTDVMLPEGVLPPSNAPLAQLPQQYAPFAQRHQGGAPAVNPDGSLIQQTDGFQMPNYNRPSGQYLEDEAEFRDALIKEVKAQKKNINKLLREVESLKLMVKELVDVLKPSAVVQPEEPIIINDTPTES